MKFTVYGLPQPQGSTRAFTPKGWTRPVITSDNKQLRSWRQDIAAAAAVAAVDGSALVHRPTGVALTLSFYFTRPGSLAKRIRDKTTKPDLDKLVRGVADALTGIVYEDDSQINRLSVLKCFGNPPRTEIEVSAT